LLIVSSAAARKCDLKNTFYGEFWFYRGNYNVGRSILTELAD